MIKEELENNLRNNKVDIEQLENDISKQDNAIFKNFRNSLLEHKVRFILVIFRRNLETCYNSLQHRKRG